QAVHGYLPHGPGRPAAAGANLFPHYFLSFVPPFILSVLILSPPILSPLILSVVGVVDEPQPTIARPKPRPTTTTAITCPILRMFRLLCLSPREMTCLRPRPCPSSVAPARGPVRRGERRGGSWSVGCRPRREVTRKWQKRSAGRAPLRRRGHLARDRARRM